MRIQYDDSCFKGILTIGAYGRAGSGLLLSLLNGHPNCIGFQDTILSGYQNWWDTVNDHSGQYLMNDWLDLYQAIFDPRFIHPSKLPEGRGSGALVWKILEGENKIYLTLFEVNEKIDRGNIYLQEPIEFEGYELSDEIRHKQALKTMRLVLKYVDHHKNLKSQKQQGKGSFYRKRTPEDSELDLDKTIREQFNLLRVVDNNRYPAFFKLNGHKYTVKIIRDEKSQDDEN